MNVGSQPSASATRSLWVIAIALSTIAVCLLLLLVQEHYRSKQTGKLQSFELIPQENTAALNKTAPSVPSRPVIRTFRSQPAASTTETDLGDSLSAKPEPVVNPPAVEAVPAQRGGYAPLTGQAQTGFGEITGKVSLKGMPPPEVRILLDATCGKLHSTPVTTRHYVVGTDGGLANVFVHIKKGLEGRRFALPEATPVLDQVDCIYDPYVLGVLANQKFTVRNSDPLLHNVHPTPKAGGNVEKNVAQPVKGMETGFVFQKPEVLVRFKCDVHPWMFAYVGVVEHPFFAVTDKEGSFTITNVPPGDYLLEAYHLKTHGGNPGLTQPISVRRGEVTVADLTLELPTQ